METKSINLNNININVNEQQYDAITSPIDKDICIIAPAGSGKTLTITAKIAYMINKLGCDPESFFITTFTRNAAEEMNVRLKNYIGDVGILCGTFHSLSYRILKRYKIIPDTDYHNIDEIQYMFNTFLESDEAIPFKESILYIFIDEYQDLNEIQHKIIKQLHSCAESLTIVGDNNQSIYNFRGGNMDYILNFHTNFKNALTYNLITNYRSTDKIINLANAIINKNPSLTKQMIPFNSTGNLPKILLFKNLFEEISYIGRSIQDDININHISPENIVVLCRTNKPIYYMEEFLTKQNIKNILIASEFKMDKLYTSEAIALSTIHSSKGLEWEHVYLLGMNDNYFPSRKDINNINEDRRLFYVAVTRCKKQLIITHSATFPISRFITELDQKLFEYDKLSQNINKTVDDISYDNSVTSLIRKLNGDDYIKLKEREIIPKLDFKTVKEYDNFCYPQFINENNLYSEFGCFTDYLIRRMLAPISINESGYSDTRANYMIMSIYLNEEMYYFYRKNIKIFGLLFDLYDTDNRKDIITKNDVQNVFQKMNIDNYIDNYNDIDMFQIISISNQIVNKAIYFDIDAKKIQVVTKNYIPFNFIDLMKKSYSNYINKNLLWKQIIPDIWIISKCHQLSFDRRKNLYVKISKKGLLDCMEWYQCIYDCITKYFNKNPICNPILKNQFISGDADLIIDDCVVDFKNSKTTEIQIEHIVQLLTYAQLARENGININKIIIYNPLYGLIHTAQINDWTKGNELIQYLYSKLNIDE